MCRKCLKLDSASGDAFPNHKPTRKPLDERIAIAKQLREGRAIKIPVRYADAAVRQARIRTIRHALGMSQAEFAPILGVSRDTLYSVELGRRVCTMSLIKIAERELRNFKRKQRRLKRAESERLAESIGQVQPAILEPPDAPRLKGQVLSLYIRGVSPAGIAYQLALRPELVRYWISTIQ